MVNRLFGKQNSGIRKLWSNNDYEWSFDLCNGGKYSYADYLLLNATRWIFADRNRRNGEKFKAKIEIYKIHKGEKYNVRNNYREQQSNYYR